MKENKGRNSKKQRDEEQYQTRPERVVVSTLKRHNNLKSTLDFEWPEFNRETDRIKAYSKRFADKSIPEVFDVTVKVENPERFDTLRELKEGDTINVTVRSISDSGVVFETVATKQVIQSSANLKKYAKLKLMVPFEAEAVVTKANRETAYIDVIKPSYNEWLKTVLKDPESQRIMHCPQVVKVRNLQLTRGGFVGQAIIPSVSEFVGQEYTVDAFIPGSQIVLNIEDDFEQWNGQTVETFVTNYMQKPGSKEEMSLVCSRKEVLKFYGDMNIKKLFDGCCETSNLWKETTKKSFDGVVTGIINSSRKCGVFVEIPSLFITGMVEMSADKLVNYKPQTKVKVNIVDFEENTYYDSATGQVRHDAPYEIENDVLRSCNIKPILKLVD